MHYVWLDCDPGHDDAMAILLACNLEDVRLLGVSTVHGNADAECTRNNAARCLYAFGGTEDIKVYSGATKPLIRPARHDPEIHGIDGLGGVEGLPDATHPGVRARLGQQYETRRAIEGLSAAVRNTWKDGAGTKITVVSTGPLTNIALFVTVYPELLLGVEQFVFMGGGVGIGNRSAAAEFNILCDPEAAQIVLDVPVKKVMVPLNVTHLAIVSSPILSRLHSNTTNPSDSTPSKPGTPLRHTLSTLINFFADAYKTTFGFAHGPPLHDALAVMYVSRPDLFTTRRFRVDVELAGAHTAGETVVDVWSYRQTDDTWGPNGKNCIVAESLDVPGFFDVLLECIERCDKISPLNQSSQACHDIR